MTPDEGHTAQLETEMERVKRWHQQQSWHLWFQWEIKELRKLHEYPKAFKDTAFMVARIGTILLILLAVVTGLLSIADVFHGRADVWKDAGTALLAGISAYIFHAGFVLISFERKGGKAVLDEMEKDVAQDEAQRK